MNTIEKLRCVWCGKDPLYIDYHDTEWGVPEHDDQKLFEKIILDGAQAGLSWITILRKREGYRKAFDGFDAEKIASYNSRKIESLLKNPEIVRNRLKVESAVKNARAYLAIKECGKTFDETLWQFTDFKTKDTKLKGHGQIQAKTPESIAMSKELLKLGFKFVGPTICYAFMQAIGMVNDHVVDCFRYAELKK